MILVRFRFTDPAIMPGFNSNSRLQQGLVRQKLEPAAPIFPDWGTIIAPLEIGMDMR